MTPGGCHSPACLGFGDSKVWGPRPRQAGPLYFDDIREHGRVAALDDDADQLSDEAREKIIR